MSVCEFCSRVETLHKELRTKKDLSSKQCKIYGEENKKFLFIIVKKERATARQIIFSVNLRKFEALLYYEAVEKRD